MTGRTVQVDEPAAILTAPDLRELRLEAEGSLVLLEVLALVPLFGPLGVFQQVGENDHVGALGWLCRTRLGELPSEPPNLQLEAEGRQDTRHFSKRAKLST